MYSDIVVIGGGASGLMAAYSAAKYLEENALNAQVTLLEKMPRPARKIIISGKGRCNITNLKDWNDFSLRIRANSALLRPAFYNLTPSALLEFFQKYGLDTVKERGDRIFPASQKASDVVDALVRACNSKSVRIICNAEVRYIKCLEDKFFIEYTRKSRYIEPKEGQEDGEFTCSKLIIASGALSYPTTGSTGDGYRWAKEMGLRVTNTFPSLTAIVPKGYKNLKLNKAEFTRHIARPTPLDRLGAKLCGVHLKNIAAILMIEGREVDEEFGEVEFTDAGLEGPIGFRFSRKAVEALQKGLKVELVLDLKPALEHKVLEDKITRFYAEIRHDPRSSKLKDKELCRVLLGKLMPRELIPAFMDMNPGLKENSVKAIATALKSWNLPIEGYVGYERAVVTAGGVAAEDLVAKSLESKKVPGLYFCGEILDIDADTGGYNLHSAFATGYFTGWNAAKSLKIIV